MKRVIGASKSELDRIQQLKDTLERQGYDTSNEYDIIYGLMQMGHSRKVAVGLMKQILQCGSKEEADI